MSELLHTRLRPASTWLRTLRLRVAAAALAAVAAAPPVFAASELVGQPAPDFALRSLGGENLRLSEHLGEVVILNFWGTWCGPCRQEMPLLDEIYLKYRRAGLTLFSINIDGGSGEGGTGGVETGDDQTGRAAEMARTLEVSYPVLLDERQDVARSFDVGTLPVTVLIDRAGVVRYVSAGYKPGYEARYTEQLRELLNE